MNTHLVTLFVLPALLATGCAAQHGACGAGPKTGGRRQGIHVVGVGEVQAAPDIARMSLGVESRAATATAAADATNAQMQKVIAALTNAGVAKPDIQTQQLSLYFERHHTPRPPMGELERAETASNEPAGEYRASNTVEVVLRDLDAAPQVIASATAAGANHMHGLSFDVEDRKPLVREAREKAVRDAQAHAEQLAELTGVKLGAVKAVFDGERDGSPGAPMMAMREATMAPVERGELTVRHTVTLVIDVAE